MLDAERKWSLAAEQAIERLAEILDAVEKDGTDAEHTDADGGRSRVILNGIHPAREYLTSEFLALVEDARRDLDAYRRAANELSTFFYCKHKKKPNAKGTLKMKHRIIIDWFDRLNKALNEKLGPADWEWRFCGAVLKWNGSGDGGQYIAAVRVRPDCWTDRAAIELLPEDVARLIGEPSEGARFSLDHCWLAVAKN